MKNLRSMLSDESGSVSTKRVIVFLIVIALIVALGISIPFPKFVPDNNLITALVTIASLCIAGSTADKFSKSVEPTIPEEK